MEGKIAVVTGGTQGLGAAVAMLFAERGARGLLTCGRNEAKGKALADRIASSTGTKVVFVQADLSKVEDCAKIIAEADQSFGRIDAVVNAIVIVTSRQAIARALITRLRYCDFFMSTSSVGGTQALSRSQDARVLFERWLNPLAGQI